MKSRLRLSVVEVVALCIVVSALTIAVYRHRLQPHFFYSVGALPELEPLRAYGLDNRVSRNFEELIVRDFFKDKRDGVFLDVGANHYRNENNTYFLEQSLGWSGIAVDALAEFAADYKAYRPRTRFVAMFASDTTDSTVQVLRAGRRQHGVIVYSSAHTARRSTGNGARGSDDHVERLAGPGRNPKGGLHVDGYRTGRAQGARRL